MTLGKSQSRFLSLVRCAFLIIILLLIGCQKIERLKTNAKAVEKSVCAKLDSFRKKACEKRAPSWMYEQIKEDLAPFSQLDVTTAAMDLLWQDQMNQSTLGGLLRVKITNNQVTLLTNRPGHPRVDYLKQGLEMLVNWATLPNVDFLISLEDSLDGVSLAIPIFVFANDPKRSSRVILIPDFEIFSGKNQDLLQSVQRANRRYPWNKKIEKCIWRGSMTGGFFTRTNFLEFPRSRAIFISLQYFDVLDAKYVGICQCNEEKAISEIYSSYFSEAMTVKDQIRYKYQLLIDGNTCSYSRAYWQLFSNTLIFKQNSRAIQWYYRALIPFVHYVPVAEDMSNLVEMIHWAKTHDPEAKAISLQAQEFAKENLTINRIFQYFYLLLLEYSKLQNSIS